MRYPKKLVAVLLAVTFILGAAGCSKKPLTRETFISEFESCGLKKTDKVDILLSNMNRRGGDNGYYAADDKETAKSLSNQVFNKFRTLYDVNASDFVLAVDTDKGSDDKRYTEFVIYMSFDSGLDAENAYNHIVESYGDEEDGKTGTNSGVTYCIDSKKSADGSTKIGTGIYVSGTAVIFIRSMSAGKDGFKFANRICSKLGLVSPSSAG